MNVEEWNKNGLKPSYYVAPCPFCSEYPKLWRRPGAWTFSHCCGIDTPRPPKINIYIERSKQEDAAREWNEYAEMRANNDAQLSLF